MTYSISCSFMVLHVYPIFHIQVKAHSTFSLSSSHSVHSYPSKTRIIPNSAHSNVILIPYVQPTSNHVKFLHEHIRPFAPCIFSYRDGRRHGRGWMDSECHGTPYFRSALNSSTKYILNVKLFRRMRARPAAAFLKASASGEAAIPGIALSFQRFSCHGNGREGE